MSNTLLVPPPHQGPAVDYDEMVDHARRTLPATLPKDAKQVLLALDIDGTLLLPDGASARVRRTVSQAIESGMNVVIATGRGIASTRPVFNELQLPDGFSVSSNGAQTVRWRRDAQGYHPELLRQVTFDPEPSGRLLLEAVPEMLIGVDDGIEGLLVSSLFPTGEVLSQQRVDSLERLLGSPTPRMIARVPGMGPEQFEALLSELPLTDVEVAVGWTAWADISAAGCTKAAGLQVLADDLGVDVSATIAMGDGTNDIDMLRWAGHGVAMGGASAEVVEAANTTTGPVDYDGAAAVIDALLERY